eukprot:COSAG02_NODE_7878_length_2806_cov_7.132989_1_plen_486_part_00
MATENPAFAGEEAAQGSSVDIEAALKNGTLTSDEAIVLQERQMELMRAEMQRLATAQLASAVEAAEGAASPLDTVQNIVARLTETRTNFHQATVYFLATDAPEVEAMARRAPLLYAGSLTMVFLQSATAAGVYFGTLQPSCATSNQCSAGYFCSVGWRDRCNYCGGHVPLPLETEGACSFELATAVSDGSKFTAPDAACTTKNNAADPNHVGFNLSRVAEICTLPYTERVGVGGVGNVFTFPDTTVASWCETCVRNDGTVDPLTANSLVAANRAAMGPADAVALAFATFIVAFTVVGELRDIELCSMAVVHAGDKLSKGWRFALGFMLGMRRWMFLPALVQSVPTLVLFKGGDALSICFNTVAILFLCDIDNIAFALALGERMRARVEAVAPVEMDDAEACAMARTKVVHLALIVLTVLGAVWSGTYGSVTSMLPLLTFGPLGGVAQVVVLGASVVETAKRVGKVLGASLLGLCGFGFLSTLLVQ